MSTLALSIRGQIEQRGFALLPKGPASAGAVDATVDPWSLVESLTGERPLVLERQPIRPIESGRSFASTRVFTPLHTDSQDLVGTPPGLQVMFCRRAAPHGGETILLDTWALLGAIERSDPSLYRALFSEVRSIPFYFGTVRSTTVARKGGALVFTWSPMPPEDAIGRALAAHLERAPVQSIAVATGDTLLVDNHRMLHGRRAFEGNERELTRLLAWMRVPFASPSALLSSADTWGPRLQSANHDRSPAVGPRLAVVLEMLTGVPPAKLAAREGVSEATLYGWRTEALSAAERALAALSAPAK